MDLEHPPSKQLKKRKTASYILFGACARGLGCRCFHRGDTAGFGACGRCLFHHGCVALTTEQCAACHIAVGELDTSRFETCWMQGCSAKTGDLCAKCSSQVSETIKRQVEANDEMSWPNLQAAVAKYPGLEQLPSVLQTKVAEKMLALMASDWKFAVDRSKKVSSFGRILLDEHRRQPQPVSLTALVNRAGFSVVESHAVTQLRREIHKRPDKWSLVGTTVHLRADKGALINSVDSLTCMLRSRGQAVPAASVLALYFGAAIDVCALIEEGNASLADDCLIPSWPSQVDPPADQDTRLNAWIAALDRG